MLLLTLHCALIALPLSWESIRTVLVMSWYCPGTAWALYLYSTGTCPERPSWYSRIVLWCVFAGMYCYPLSVDLALHRHEATLHWHCIGTSTHALRLLCRYPCVCPALMLHSKCAEIVLAPCRHGTVCVQSVYCVGFMSQHGRSIRSRFHVDPGVDVGRVGAELASMRGLSLGGRSGADLGSMRGRPWGS